MNRILARTGLGAMLLAAGVAVAAERTVTLAVERMSCASCPFIVERSLTRVPGVKHAEVSLEKKTAVVTFDDAETDVAALTNATANAGFPSRLVDK